MFPILKPRKTKSDTRLNCDFLGTLCAYTVLKSHIFFTACSVMNYSVHY